MSWQRRGFSGDALACLAFANMYFLHVWRTLLGPALQYHLKILPGALDFVMLFVDISGVALLMYLSLAAARRWLGQTAVSSMEFLFLFLLFVLAINAYKPELWNGVLLVINHWPHRSLVLAPVVAGCAVLVAHKRPRLMRHLFSLFGWILLPCVLVTTSKSAYVLILRPVQPPTVFSSPFVSDARPRPARTALILFDMLDYELVFANRPANEQFPEFDRLRNQALFERGAASPSEWTLITLPAMFTGRLVTEAVPTAPDDLRLTLDGTSKISWKLVPTIFAEARNEGMAVGLVGWYHPYCRLFGALLHSCEWVPFPEKLEDRGSTPVSIARAMTGVVVEDLLGQDPPLEVERIVGMQRDARRKYIESYKRVVDAATRALTDPALDLAVIHVPVPHPPLIYDRLTQQFTTAGGGNYLDNVALADRTLGAFRREMERTGMWDATNVVITADHGFRSNGLPEWKHQATPLHVPFVIKMSNSEQHLEDDHSFSTIIVHDVLWALLNKKIATPEAAKQYLRVTQTGHTQSIS